MITPLDIQNKEFSRAVRGYNQEEVDLFLDEIMADYDKLLSENQDLKRQLEETKGKVESYKDTEGAVLKTLEAAKSLMNDTSASAEKRASILVKNAELDADLKQRQARDNVERLKEEEAKLNARVTAMKVKFRSFLESELERFDSLSDDIFGIPDGSLLSSEDGTIARGQRIAPAVSSSDDLFKTIVNVKPEDKSGDR